LNGWLQNCFAFSGTGFWADTADIMVTGRISDRATTGIVYKRWILGPNRLFDQKPDRFSSVAVARIGTQLSRQNEPQEAVGK